MVIETELTGESVNIRFQGAVELFKAIEERKAGTHLEGGARFVDFSHLQMPTQPTDQEAFSSRVWEIVDEALSGKERIKNVLQTKYSADNQIHTHDDLMAIEYDFFGDPYLASYLIEKTLQLDLGDALQGVVRVLVDTRTRHSTDTFRSQWEEARAMVNFVPMNVAA